MMSADKLSNLKQLAVDIQTKQNRPTNTQATWMAERIVSVYRARDFVNPAAFSVALASLFQSYSAEAGLIVTDPVQGLPAKQKFPPSLAEVKEALDEKVWWAKCLEMAVNRMEVANATV
jgi:hypothetical protein